MRLLVSITAVAFAVTTAVFAQDARLKQLDTSQQGREWNAVGRLDIGGRGFCTGALIADNLVLTAAHCLFDQETGRRIDHKTVEFLAGWRNGRASAYRSVRRAVVHPGFAVNRGVETESVRNDVALLELEQPIRNGIIFPFTTGDRPRRGDEIGVVSYAEDRSEAPALQDVCQVLSRQDGVLVTSCKVGFGSSGAPIFSFENGQAQIVSVVSAMARSDGKPVSLGTSLTQPLADLQAQLDAGQGYSIEPIPDPVRVRVGTVRNNTGAKFVKP